MSQYWNESKKGVAYPPIQPREQHAQRARHMRTRVTEILGIECDAFAPHCACSARLTRFLSSLAQVPDRHGWDDRRRHS